VSAKLRKYKISVRMDDALLEATRRCIAERFAAGHTPSRSLLRIIGGELEQAWWPDRKLRQRNRELAWLHGVQQEINYRAKTQYGNGRGARTKAERDVAKSHDLSVSGLRRKRFRFRERLKKHEEELEQQRKASAEKVGHFFAKSDI
jgi:hypothetical protein